MLISPGSVVVISCPSRLTESVWNSLVCMGLGWSSTIPAVTTFTASKKLLEFFGTGTLHLILQQHSLMMYLEWVTFLYPYPKEIKLQGYSVLLVNLLGNLGEPTGTLLD